MNKKAIRIIAVVLAIIMALSVLAIILQVFGIDESYTALPMTGESNLVYIIVGCVLAAAIIAIICVIVIPKIKKKKNGK